MARIDKFRCFLSDITSVALDPGVIPEATYVPPKKKHQTKHQGWEVCSCLSARHHPDSKIQHLLHRTCQTVRHFRAVLVNKYKYICDGEVHNTASIDAATVAICVCCTRPFNSLLTKRHHLMVTHTSHVLQNPRHRNPRVQKTPSPSTNLEDIHDTAF